MVVSHEGNSDLALPQRLLGWLRRSLPLGAEVHTVADGQFHSIHPALQARVRNGELISSGFAGAGSDRE